MIKKQTEKQKPTKKLQKRLKKLPQKNPTENSRQRPVMHFASPVSEQVSIEAGKKKPLLTEDASKGKNKTPQLEGRF
jgi:hypothetical protein